MLHLDDDGFIRAPVALVYRRLTNIAAWPEWWPGMDVRPMTGPDSGERWALELRRGIWALRIGARPHTYRHDVGFKLALDGDVSGTAEFWLEDLPAGTVVHHLLSATAARAPVRTLTTYRTVVRRGLWAFKDRMQTEVRTAIGLPP